LTGFLIYDNISLITVFAWLAKRIACWLAVPVDLATISSPSVPPRMRFFLNRYHLSLFMQPRATPGEAGFRAAQNHSGASVPWQCRKDGARLFVTGFLVFIPCFELRS
jgi:hypothetical protein